ncbi:DgyrCDS5788 [Dimorphilus gyrociliatus]|uniref:DgyrCDS5788 n=1 Tax=Dimorphilus gyrociliatus TaxID=2664684 RepID=A0A7I8VMK6_9ANNE|nr:DgyrCDS5788 [Dimorphilus gyrociliatus]
MAGRGRGRGGRGVSFNIDQLGFGRGEALPKATLQPPPTFPNVTQVDKILKKLEFDLTDSVLYLQPLTQQVHPLQTSEEISYIIAVKQNFRNKMRESGYNVLAEKDKCLKKYSDKYQLGIQNGSWEPNLKILPSELHPKKKKMRKMVKPNITKLKLDADKKLKELEEFEKVNDDDDVEEEEKKNEEGIIEEEEYDEEDLEETDYNMTYFDNGESYGGDDDDDLDEDALY